MTKIIAVSEEQFDSEVLNAGTPVIVDFWAPWCGPCRAFAPTFDAAAEKYNGRVKFCKVNVDECGGVAEVLRISVIPTLMMFNGGQPLYMRTGAIDGSALDAFIEKVFESN